jgi:hypothetical protein
LEQGYHADEQRNAGNQQRDRQGRFGFQGKNRNDKYLSHFAISSAENRILPLNEPLDFPGAPA